MMMDFAGRLKRLRIEKGYSQATLAKKITDAGQKPGEASIAKYENGRIYPNLQTAACMADCFGVSIDYLACGEKAAVVSVDGLTDEQINLMTELTRALRQQNKGRRGNPVDDLPGHVREDTGVRVPAMVDVDAAQPIAQKHPDAGTAGTGV